MKLHIDLDTSDKTSCAQFATLANSLISKPETVKQPFSVTVPEIVAAGPIDYPTPEQGKYIGSEEEKRDKAIAEAMKANGDIPKI